MKRRRVDRALAAALLALAVLLTVAVQFAGVPPDAVAGSAASAEPDGRLALFRLLAELGFAPEEWRRTPARLPRGAHVVWAAAAPEPFPGAGEDEQGSEQVGELPAELRERGHYKAFVEQGGTLVLPAGEETDVFLVEELGLDALRGDPPRRDDGRSGEPRCVLAPGGEVLELGPPAAAFDASATGEGIEGLLPTEDGGWLALAAPLGEGRVVLLAGDVFARNGEPSEVGPAEVDKGGTEPPGIGDADHAVIAVRLVEALDRGGRLLFDEYALGRWQPDSAIGLAVSGARGLLTLHLVLFCGLLVWRATWRREFPRDPVSFARLSPLARARAQAGLLARAGRWDMLAAMLRRGVLRRLCARLRLSLAGEPGRVDALDADGRDPAWEAWAEERVLALARATGEREALERYRRAFLGGLAAARGGARELAGLAAELMTLERRVEERAGRARTRAGRRGPLSGIVP